MKPIGGFFELELPRLDAAWHEDATPLASGRACLHHIIRSIAPRRVYLPFYVCDAVLQGIEAAEASYEFYAVDEQLAPSCDRPADPRDVLLVVNYFGTMTEAMDGWASAANVVIDDSQAFFRRGRAQGWSFNSARKFFGVPDGGYVYGPLGSARHCPPSVTDDVEHLVARWRGASDAALDLYRAHEARFTADVRAMSPLSERLLAGVDYAAVAAARRANFALVHEKLGDANRLAPSLGARDVPLCYPFWPRRAVAHQQLWDLGIFAPRLWPEVAHRRLPGFAFERQLASELLPLPIDQRYDTADMQDLCGRVGTLL